LFKRPAQRRRFGKKTLRRIAVAVLTVLAVGGASVAGMAYVNSRSDEERKDAQENIPA
jgi:hypothetical protein